jgi:hypothetical protein
VNSAADVRRSRFRYLGDEHADPPRGHGPASQGNVGERGGGGLRRQGMPCRDPAGQSVVPAKPRYRVVEERGEARWPAGGARDLIAVAGQPAVVRPVGQFAEHAPSGHRYVVKRGGIGRAGKRRAAPMIATDSPGPSSATCIYPPKPRNGIKVTSDVANFPARLYGTIASTPTKC